LRRERGGNALTQKAGCGKFVNQGMARSRRKKVVWYKTGVFRACTTKACIIYFGRKNHREKGPGKIHHKREGLIGENIFEEKGGAGH